jgi:hypothetical protein
VSPPLGGEEEFEMRTRDSSDMDRSSGESATDVTVRNMVISAMLLVYLLLTATTNIYESFPLYCAIIDHLCGLVVRVPGYRPRGQGSIPGVTRFSKK